MNNQADISILNDAEPDFVAGGGPFSPIPQPCAIDIFRAAAIVAASLAHPR
jgi:hypothetical protein